MGLPQDIIAKKRDGRDLSQSEIEQFVAGVVDGSFKDYQASALLMAVVLKGMNAEETGWLTEAMMRSGRIVELPEITRPKVDKHSTGGVGDKVSLILAPLAASAGLCVPMMSGRGLGHTGGTLDKLESIAGFDVNLDEARYRRQLAEIHQAMIGQSEDMVPADRILYALRDVTATVESIPLISASIMSKKMAEGIDALVLDVKCGSGAFMRTEADARELAQSLVSIARRMGREASAYITRMEEPLGKAVGNALEVIECIDCLKGGGPADLMEVTYALTAEMMRLGGLVETAEAAMPQLREKIANGAALAAFREMVAAQGGDTGVIDDYGKFPSAAEVHDLTAEAGGYVAGVDARAVGEAVHLLGAGRSRTDGAVDPAVGVVLHKKVGDAVQAGDLLCEIHSNDPGLLKLAMEKLSRGYRIEQAAPPPRDLIIATLTT